MKKINPNISVDSVVFGFDLKELKVLLVDRILLHRIMSISFSRISLCPEIIAGMMRIQTRPSAGY